MKSILKRNRVLAVIALIGLLASLVPLISRVQAEKSNKYYDIVLDYNSMRSMARQSSQSEDEWIDLFKSLGVDKVALSEASALNLHDNAAIPVYAMTVKKAAESYGWEDQYPAEVAQWLRESTDVSDAIIWTETAASYEWILNAFEARFEDFEAKTYLEGEHGFIFIQQQKNGMKGEKLLDLRLGIWPDTVELFERHGYQIIPRSVTEKNMNGTKFAKAYIEELKHFNAPYFMNNGDELVGYEDDESLELLTQYLNESGASVAMMEQNDQSLNLTWPGIEDLLDETGYHGVRVFNEWAYIQNRYQYCGYEGPEEITNTFFRAIAERNCKIIYLKMILEPDNDVSWDADEKEWTYVTDPADYEKMLSDLDARLAPLGYTRGTVPAMELKTPSTALRLVQSIGTAALLVLLFDLFFRIGARWRTILLALGVLGFAALSVLKPSLFRLLLSMSGGIVMPSLAAVGLCRELMEKRKSEPYLRFGKLLGYTLGVSALTILTAFCGSLLATAALSQLSYMIEMELYRGVKIMQLIPIGLFILAYLVVYAYEETGARKAVLAHTGTRGEKGRIKRFNTYFAELMKTPMQLGWFLAVVVIAVAAVFMLLVFVYYIYRTGACLPQLPGKCAHRPPTHEGNDHRLANADALYLVAAPRNEIPAHGFRHGYEHRPCQRGQYLPAHSHAVSAQPAAHRLGRALRPSHRPCGRCDRGTCLPPCAQGLRGGEWLTF